MSVDIATLQIRIDSSETQNATRNLEQMNNAGGRAETVTSSLADAARKLQGALAVLGIVKIVSEVIKMSDAYDQMTARLKIATNSTSQFLTVQKELIGLSERQRVSLESTTDLYAKASAATSDMGASQKDILKFTEGVSAALMINGSSAESAAGALNQLGQALGGAKIQAEEYSSILDGARPLLQAVANNIGATGGSVAMLTSLVRAGKVDSTEFFAAAVKGSDELIASGRQIPITFSQAIGIAKDRLMVFVGGMNESTGVVTAMSQSVVLASNAIVFMAKNLDAVVSVVGTLIAARVISWAVDFTTGLYATVTASRAAAAAAIATAQANVAATAAARTLALARVVELEATVAATAGGSALAIATTSLAGAQARAVLAEEAHIATLLALTAAQRAASVAAGVLTGAMTLLGGHIGLIITALGIGATAWYMWGKSSTDAQNAASGGMEQSTSEILANIEKQNVKLRERIALASAGQTELAKTESPAAQEAAKTLSKLNDLRSRAATLTGVEQITVVELTLKYEQLTGAMKGNLGLKNELERLNSKKTTADWMVEYATKAEKLAAKLAEVGKSYKDGVIPPELKKRIEDSFAAQDSGAKKSADALKEATKSAQDFIAQMQIEASEIGKSEDQVKMMAAARAAAKAPTAALRLEIMSEALALSIAKTAWEEKLEAEKKAADLQKNYDDTADGVWEQVRAIEAEIQAYGKLASEITGLGIAKVTAALQAPELTDAETAALERQLAALQRLQTLQGIKQGLDTSPSVAKAKELLDILTAVDAATKSAADGMAASFGKVGSAIGGLTTALSGYAVQQQAIAAQLAAATKDAYGDPTKVAKAQAAAAQQGAQAQIKSYGDMASAAKGFFKENTAGYRALEGAEKAYRAVEMAMAIESMVKKLFTVSAVTTATVGGEAAKAAAVQAGVATQLTADTVKGTSAAAVAVATQAQGDPYSAWVRMAAMAAAMAALGFAVGGSGGGGGQTAAEVQAAQGTGSVFGDSDAKSASIQRSLDRLAENSGGLIPINQGMLSALRSIEASMSGLTNLIVRANGVTDGSNMGITTGQINIGKPTDAISGVMTEVTKGLLGPGLGNSVAKFINNVWGKTTKNIVDSGLQFGGSVRDLQDGEGYKQYASVDTTKSSWFGLSKKTSNSVQTAGLNNELSAQFGLIFTNLEDALTSAAIGMGIGAAQVTNVLDSLTLATTSVSLKDLKGDDLTAALNGVISKAMDEMSQAVFPEFDKFRAVGEGYAETVIRIASNYATLDAALSSISTTFGATGVASLAARERLIGLAGGIENFTALTSSFSENFLTEAERLAPVQKYVTAQLAALGYAGLNTRDDFKAAVLGLANSGALATEAGAKTYAGLLSLAEAFAKTTAATDDLTMSQQAIADQAKDLQTQLNELTKSETALLAIQRAGIADVNKALFDQVQAAKAVVSAKDALGKAYEREATAAQTALDKSKSWVATLNGLNPSLALGGQSILTPQQKYAEARVQLEKTLAAANAGDTTARSKLDSVEQAFLAASQVVNASDAKYAADYARVLAANDEALKWASAQVDVQQASLDALKAQVSGLITINDSVLTVAQAIANLHAAMGAATGMGVKFDGSHAGGLANVPFDGYAAELHRGEVVVDAQAASAMRRYFGGAPSQGGGNTDALVAEIKGLREEVKGLRADQAKQTGATIQATVESNDKAAQTVVAGVDKSSKSAVWDRRVEYSA